MNPDYDGLIQELKNRKAIPVVVVYAVEGESVAIDFLTTPAYEDADVVLKKDIIKATRRTVDNMDSNI